MSTSKRSADVIAAGAVHHVDLVLTGVGPDEAGHRLRRRQYPRPTLFLTGSGRS